MRLKSFHGPTLTEAMRSVRNALGEDAIIVATREDENGGIRVTAAIEDAPRAPSPNRTASLPTDGSEALEEIAKALVHHQVYPDLAEKLMATATQFVNDDPLLCLGAALDTHFKFSAIEPNKPLMLVGPPGAGKTLCTAKCATQATMAKKKPVVVSTDIERAGGLEQLAAFTRLLNVSLLELDDWHALRDLVSVHDRQPVFIDMAGRNPFDPEEKESARAFVAAIGGDASLVLPAGLDASEAIDLAHEFKSIGASRLIVTRLDVVRRLGSLLRIAFDSRLPLACLSASPKVTEALQPMNPVVLARLLLNTRKSSTAAAMPKERGLDAAIAGGKR